MHTSATSSSARTLLALTIACVLLGACADGASSSRGAATDSGYAANQDSNRNTDASGSTEIVVVDQAGDTVSLSQPARRVVSVLPSVNEFLLAMGAGELIAARTDYDVQQELENLPSIGGGLDPSLEVLINLSPDLVITWHGPAHNRLREQLRAVGIATFGVGTQDTAEVFRSLHSLGELIGNTRAADSLRNTISAEFADVVASVRGLPRPTVLYALSIAPPMTTGPHTYVSELVGVAGGTNVFADLTNDFPAIALEEIVRRDPAVILLPADSTNAGARIRSLHSTPGWRDLPAVREGRVITISSLLLDRPGPHMGTVARMIRNGLHPHTASR